MTARAGVDCGMMTLTGLHRARSGPPKNALAMDTPGGVTNLFRALLLLLMHHRDPLHLPRIARLHDGEIDARRKRGEIDTHRARAALRKHFRAEEIQNLDFEIILRLRGEPVATLSQRWE